MEVVETIHEQVENHTEARHTIVRLAVEKDENNCGAMIVQAV